MTSDRILLGWFFIGWFASGLVACRPATHSPPVDEAPSTAARAPGTERMARRLAAFADNASPATYVFQNVERLAWLQSQPLPKSPSESVRLQLDLANEYLRAGHSEDAVREFRKTLTTIEDSPQDHPPLLASRIRSLLAVSYLRLGEQENCLHHHNLDSCLLPIQGQGIHQEQRGSRAAMEEFGRLLQDAPNDLASLWLYNLAAMTVGDYPDGVPKAWRIPEEAFRSDADIGRFLDVAPAVGLDTFGTAGGVVVDDFNGDTRLDVMVSSWGLRDPLRLFVQERDTETSSMNFKEQSESLDGLTGGLNLIQADYDNDGDIDVLVLRGAWMRDQGRQPNSLLQNDGHGNFDDVTEASGLLSFFPTQTAAWGDYDNDGWLDLFIGNESAPGSLHPCELYRNNGPDASGQITFTEVAANAGVAAGGMVKGVSWGDYDNDGWPDLYLSRMNDPNLLLRNRGGDGKQPPTFEDVTAVAGVAEPQNSFPTWFFDYDNDGQLDLFAAGYGRTFLEARATQEVAFYLGRMSDDLATSRLYRNNGDGTFEDVTESAGLAQPVLAMGANFGDLDNDGWLDLYLGTGAPDFRALVPNRMFRGHPPQAEAGRGNTGHRFQDITTSGGFGHLQKGHGVAFADFDEDGDQDIFAVIGGAFSGDGYPNVLFQNPGHDQRFAILKLEGRNANRAAIGARLRVDVETPDGDRQIHRVLSSGGSFGASPLRAEVGLGDARRILRVVVEWPGGGREDFTDIPINSRTILRQGG